jgi:hypothetical protein
LNGVINEIEHLSLAIGLMPIEQSPTSNRTIQRAHLLKLEILSNPTTKDSALEYIRNKQQSQQQTTNNDQPVTRGRSSAQSI